MIFIDVDTAVTVPVNAMPLIDDTDFKSREVAITYDQAGMDLVWNFVTSAGVITQTAVTPTTAGVYDWTHVGDGMYKIEIPASGGGSINNDAEGVGYFTGFCTGVLPWRGPDIVFRAAALNDALIDGGDNLDVNTVAVSGDTVAADNLESMFDGTGYAGGSTKLNVNTDTITASAITAVSINANALDGKGDWNTSTPPTASAVADQVWDEATAGHVGAGSYGKAVGDGVTAWVTATGFATPTNITAGTITTVTNLTNAPTSGDLTATMKTSVTTAATSATPIAASVSGNVDGNVSGTVILADTSSDAIIADAIWNAATATYGGVGSYGEHVEALTAGGDATEAKQDQLIAACITNATGVDIAADIIALKAETTLIVADTNELQTDWVDGGRLDNLLDGAASAGDPWTTTLPGAYGAGTAGEILGDWKNAGRLDAILDTIAADTTTDIPALIGTAQADLDIITGVSGVNLLTATQASIDAIEADSNELQTNQGNWLTATGFSTHAALDVWHVAATSVVTASTIGVQLKTNVDAVMSAIETDTQDIQTQIGTAGAGLTALPDQTMNITGNLSGSVGSVTGHTAQTGDSYALANGATGFAAIDTVVDAIKVITDALGATAAARLALSAGQIIPATVDTVTNTHTPTTTEFQADDITEATADHYNGRIVVWTSGALAGQATDITDYAAVGGIGQFTVTGMTEAPADDDTFIIV